MCSQPQSEADGWPAFPESGHLQLQGKLRQGWSPRLSPRGGVSRKLSWEPEHSACFLNGPRRGGEGCSLSLHRWKNQGGLASTSQLLDIMTTLGPVIDCQLPMLFFLLNKLTKYQSLQLESEAQWGPISCGPDTRLAPL